MAILGPADVLPGSWPPAAELSLIKELLVACSQRYRSNFADRTNADFSLCGRISDR
jgi:hypothetical protein